jgi:hypothetical protein
MAKSVHTRDHTGARPDGFFTKPGDRGLTTAHDPSIARSFDKPGEPAHERHGHRGHPIGGVTEGKTFRAPGAIDIQPRQGRAKESLPVPYHANVTSRQIAAAGKGGMGHPGASVTDGGQTITTSAAAAPLENAYGLPLSRKFRPAPVSDAFKTAPAYGKPQQDVLGEALSASDFNTQCAHAALPESTTEE